MKTNEPAIRQNVGKPSDNFRKAMQQILSVPKDEMLRREVAYKTARKNKNRKRHR